MQLFIWITLGIVCSLAGETFCKYASRHSNQLMYLYMLGAAISWASSAYVWTNIYKLRSITEMLVIYNPTQMILLSAVGIILFNEPITLKLVISFMLLGTAIWLMS